MDIQPVLYRCAHTDDLIQARSQEIHPSRVQNLVVDSAQSVMLPGEVDEHVVVSMLGLQHGNNLP